MKHLIAFSTIFFFGISFAFTQNETCNCKADLDFIVSKLKKMPSYKKQIKGDKKENFETVYKMLSLQMKQPIAIEACFKLLLKQTNLINDNHLSLSIKQPFLDINSNTRKIGFNHPETDRNIEDLKNELSQKKTNSIEGIYNYSTSLKVGIYYDDNKNQYIGVILESNLKQWEIGDISFYAYKTINNKYNIYHYKLENKTPRLLKSLTFENGRLWSYKKKGTSDVEFIKKNQKSFTFKQLNENTQYLYFANFSNSKKKDLLAFYEETKNKLTAKNIIVDLRSNTGGNKKYSDPFIKLLKHKNVYILTNAFTASNGEQFTLKLKKLKHATHLGQTTFGVIAYGLNYGRSYTTPSKYFSVTPTDMNFHKYFQYESIGIKPDITLDFKTDWIRQTLDIISENK
ncbi:S41 family peptidase [Lacinutrix sp. 5H-3-7-4]|uniref:S41 family peptidase n=1 Tax=Lacinutrix sp. (strain 5H-3-7-4) TaxID=983544 RepID=UPI00020A3557|nr:S41 family peptidase [Lacinutrix sp. 5H-3-7-4]AEH02281.1 peptidase S41 [Lacinutrix sp. 5H-3-7-4]